MGRGLHIGPSLLSGHRSVPAPVVRAVLLVLRRPRGNGHCHLGHGPRTNGQLGRSGCLGTAASSRIRSQRVLRVLAYHRVAHPSAPLDPALISATPDSFRRQMLHLKKSYMPVDLEHVLEAFLYNRALPKRAVHVTVDDAYRDFAEVAWPILRGLGIPVTVFVPAAYPGEPSREFWWDRLHRLTTSAPSGAWRERLPAAIEASGARRPSPGDLRAVLRRLPHDEIEALLDSACR